MEKHILLKVKDLHKAYGKGESTMKALDGVDLEIYEGELLVIVGSSGSGKSTLLNMIGGIDQPDEGTVLFEEKNIALRGDRSLTDYRHNSVGFIFQSFNLIGELTAIENVRLTAESPEHAKEALRMVGLSDREDSYPSQLSGGQQQRVSIARALAKKSRILLCDEPTGALDYETGKGILEILEDLCHRDKQTIVFVTHTKEIGKMADRVIRMKDGKIRETIINENPLSSKEIEW